MSAQYQTKAGDMLDAICWKFYGSSESGILEAVYAANQNLSFRGEVLPAGLIITLPDIATTQTQALSLF
jgi:phage tail protein X